MPKTVTFTLVPKSGRGMQTARHAQALEDQTDSFRTYQRVIDENNAWNQKYEDGSFSLPTASGPMWDVHYYNSIDPLTSGSLPVTKALYSANATTSFTGTNTVFYTNGGDGTVTVNGVNFTVTSPFETQFLTVKNRCFIAGSKYGMSVVPTVMQRWPSLATYTWGKGGPTTALGYTPYTNASNATTKVFYKAADAFGANTVATLSAINWPTSLPFTASPTWDGKTAVYDGTEKYTITTSTTGVLTVTPTTPNTKSLKDVLVYYGSISWGTTPPSYAYAYYNPTTGHCTNASPVLTLSEQNIGPVRVEITGFIRTNDAQYTKIILFRSQLKDGSAVLLPMKLDSAHAGTIGVDSSGLIDNNASDSNKTYVDDRADNQLAQVIGRFEAPSLNNPPPSDTRFTAYWDAHMWCVSAATPYRVNFSGDQAQITLGVPEESFPAVNYLDVPAEDGFFTGLRNVGSALILGTEKNLYTVSGNSANTYRLVRIESRAAPLSGECMQNFPSDIDSTTSSLVYVGKDARLWRLFPGGRSEDMGAPIQDKLDLIEKTSQRPARLIVFNKAKQWYIGVGIRSTANVRYDWYFLDVDQKKWVDLGYADATAAMWIGAGGGIAYSGSGADFYEWIATTSLTAGFVSVFLNYPSGTDATNGVLESQLLDMGDKVAKKSLQEVIVHTAGKSTVGWAAATRYENESGSYTNLTLAPSVGTPRSTSTGVYRYVPQSPTSFHSIQLKVTIGRLNNAIANREFVSKIQIVYTTDSTGVGGEP